MEFELLEHPADIGFRARGRDLAELFANSAKALVWIMLDPEHIEPKQPIQFSARAGDYESLLVSFLNEVLYLVDSRRLALATFEIIRLSETHVNCIAKGEPRDIKKHPPKLVVKAVTYHQLKIVQSGEEWIAEVYVDV